MQCGSVQYLDGVFLVHVSTIYEQEYVNSASNDFEYVQRLVLLETGVTEYEREIKSIGLDNESTSKCGQVITQTLCLAGSRLWSNLMKTIKSKQKISFSF
jgi:hypothetical protein